MLNSLSKNIWLVLTIVIPGIFTYGLLRIFLIILGTTVFNNLFYSMDNSISINACIVVVIGLIQQMFGILLEALIEIRSKDGPLKKLVWDRHFKTATDREQLSMGNFYLSLNITIGLYFFIISFCFI